MNTFHKLLFSPVTRLFAGVIVILAAMSLLSPAMYKISGDNQLTGGIGYLLSGSIMLGCYILLYHYYEKRKVNELQSSNAIKYLSSGFGVGILLISISVFLIFLCGGYSINQTRITTYLIYSLCLYFYVGVSEELLLRGVIYRLLEEKLGTTIAILISAFIFGFLHVMNDNATLFSSLAIALEAGVLLAVAYAWKRSLWFAIGLHWAWNFGEGSIWGLPISGREIHNSLFTGTIEGPDWLTGGAFGPENSIPVVLVCTMAAIYIMYRMKKEGKWIAPYWKRP